MQLAEINRNWYGDQVVGSSAARPVSFFNDGGRRSYPKGGGHPEDVGLQDPHRYEEHRQPDEVVSYVLSPGSVP